jgi:sterol 3beta-glucosyltransferase
MPSSKTKITLLAITSRGYVQPLIALGVGLKKAGYKVTVAAHHRNRDWIESYGLGYSPVRLDYKALLQKGGQTWLKSGDNPLKALGGWINLWQKGMSQVNELLDDCLDACQGTDAIINTPLLPGYHIAEKLHIPCFLFMPTPLHPTGDYPCPELPFRAGLGKPFNRATYTLYEWATWLVAKYPVNQWRKSLGLCPIRLETVFRYLRRQGTPFLNEHSPHILPRPRDWPDNVHVTGYWFLENPEGWKPPDSLLTFLGNGPPPICIGFGSVTDRNIAARVVDISIKALERTRQRGIFLPGWSGLDIDLPGSILQVDSILYTWLFSRVKAVVHHGGIGTIGTALRSGVPSVAVPFFADHFFCGMRLHDIGTGPAPIPRKQLTVDTLSDAIIAMISDNSLMTNVRRIQKKMEAEDGITNAVNIVAQHLEGR